MYPAIKHVQLFAKLKNPKIEVSDGVNIKTFNSDQVDLINCDENYHFDMFDSLKNSFSKRSITISKMPWLDTGTRSISWSLPNQFEGYL